MRKVETLNVVRRHFEIIDIEYPDEPFKNVFSDLRDRPMIRELSPYDKRNNYYRNQWLNKSLPISIYYFF